ncbi:hypothetical protein D1AOALGA4SA_1303 [Olavius algarvensis Delta 1 endosymbiont]|nr:hypothetical protein D1AOALGA4SA_1303 [Olavius algarvensis Delta 1 endosymbiont]
MKHGFFKWRTLVKMAVIGVIIVIYAKSVEMTAVIDTLNLHLLSSILIVQPLILASIIMMTIRFAVLVSKRMALLVPTFKAMIIAIGMNAMLVGRLSELLKVAYLKKRSGIPINNGLAAVFLERISDFIMLCLIAMAGVGIFFVKLKVTAVIGSLCALSVLGVIAYHYYQPLLRLINRIPWTGGRAFLTDACEHLASVIKTGAFYKSLIFGAAGWGLSFASIVLFLYLEGSIPFSLPSAFAVFLGCTIGGAVNILPGSIGTYEASSTIALMKVGADLEQALVLSIVLHVTQILLGAVGALIIVMTEAIGISSLISSAKSEMLRHKGT